MLVAVVVTMLVVGVPDAESYLLLGAVVLAGVLGAVDDASKIAHERSLGLTPAMKLVAQFAIAIAFVLVAVNVLGVAPTVEIPFICTIDMGGAGHRDPGAGRRPVYSVDLRGPSAPCWW